MLRWEKKQKPHERFKTATVNNFPVYKGKTNQPSSNEYAFSD